MDVYIFDTGKFVGGGQIYNSRLCEALSEIQDVDNVIFCCPIAPKLRLQQSSGKIKIQTSLLKALMKLIIGRRRTKRTVVIGSSFDAILCPIFLCLGFERSC